MNKYKIILVRHGESETNIDKNKYFVKDRYDQHVALTELGIKQDALAGFNTLTKKMGYDDKNVVIWGHSMGGALALKTIRELEKHENRTVKGFIDSTFTNGNMIKKHFLDSKLGEIEKIPQDVIDNLEIAHNYMIVKINYLKGRI